MKINFLEYKKKRESQMQLAKRCSVILLGLGMLTVILLKSLSYSFSERIQFIVLTSSLVLFFIGSIIQLFLKINCPECKNNIAFKEGQFCNHCSCDLSKELKEINDLH